MTLAWLSHIQQLLRVAEDEESLASALATLAGTTLGGRGLVLLYERSGHRVMRGYRIDAGEGDALSKTIVSRVRKTRRPFASSDILTDPEVSGVRSLRETGARSLVCHPVLWQEACVGAIYVDHREPGRMGEAHAGAVVGQVAAVCAELLARLGRRPRGNGPELNEFGLVGDSPPMHRLREQLRPLSASRASSLVLLLTGETGTGKSAIARALHSRGARAGGPFVSVNCTAQPEGMFEALVFGHPRGAFTGAEIQRPGFFGAASGGTLFLDEIGDMPLSQQPKLLDALQERRYSRMGEPEKVRDMDFHVFCATNHDLNAAVAAGRFRADLLSRLSANVVRVPSLRERGESDIRLLLRNRLAEVVGGVTEGSPLPDVEQFFTRQAESFLYRYHWPYNVRQLLNIFQNESLLQRLRTGGREQVRLVDLEPVLGGCELVPNGVVAPGTPGELSLTPGRTLLQLDTWWEEMRNAYIRRTFLDCEENYSRTAQRLGCSRDVIYRTVKHSTAEALSPGGTPTRRT